MEMEEGMDISVDNTNARLMIAHLSFDLSTLSKSEMLVLQLLVDRYPQACTREEIINAGWTGKVVTDNSINVAIRNIRGALNTQGLDDFVRTERGIGYSVSNIDIAKLTESVVSDSPTPTPTSMRGDKKSSTLSTPFKLFIIVFLFCVIINIIRLYSRAISL